MPSTEVLIQDDLGQRVPSVPSVPIVAGGSVTFAAGDGADSLLYFSSATVSILTPAPASPVSLAAGATVTYTFGAPGSAAYGVVVAPPETGAPSSFDFAAATPPALVIQAGGGLPFPGPTMPIRTG
jgi:hypothetical protein